MLTGPQIVTLLFWISLFPYLIFMVLFYRHRGIHPIKSRAPRVTLFQGFLIIIFGADVCFGAIFTFACQIYSWIMFFSSTFMQGCFLYRLIQLVFNYEITQNISELKENRKLKDWKSNWFTTHRYIAQDKFMIRFFSTIVVLWIIYLIIWEGSGKPFCQHGVSTNNPWNIFYEAEGVLWIVVCLILAQRTWKYPPDAFGIKMEFKCVVGGTLVVALVFGIVSRIHPSLAWLLDVGLIGCCHPYLIFTLVVPYFKTRKQIKLTQDQVRTEMSTLESWLARPEGVKVFLEYLKTEFSSENLLFWLDVHYYKNMSLNDLDVIKDEVRQIYDKFFELASPCAINLPQELVENTQHSVQQILNANAEQLRKMKPDEILNIFDAARKEIYLLMASDTFRRFQESSAFQKLSNNVPSKSKSGDRKMEMDELLGTKEGLLDLVHELRGEGGRSIAGADSKDSFTKDSSSSLMKSNSADMLFRGASKGSSRRGEGPGGEGPDSPSNFSDSPGNDRSQEDLRAQELDNSRPQTIITDLDLTTPKKLVAVETPGGETREIELSQRGVDASPV